MKTILFVAYGGGHINMLIPVIKEMGKCSTYKIVVLGLTTAAVTLKKHNIPYIGFKDILESSDVDARLVGERLFASMQGPLIVDKEETIAYLGLSFVDLVKRYGQKEADKRYAESGRAAFLPLSVMERLISTAQPDLVIATNSPRAEKAVLLQAKSMGIPAVCLVDLFDPREIADRLGQPGYANKVCVFSESVKQLLMESGRPDSEVEVTGNPDFDLLNSDSLKEKAKKYRLNYFGKKYVILWARHSGEMNRELNSLIDDKLIEIAERHPDIFFVFRPHPNDPKEYAALPGNICVSGVKDDVQTLLLSSDLVLTISSTVGLQAVACKKPLVTIDMGPTWEYTPYSKMGMSHGVKNLDDLENVILEELGASSNRSDNAFIPGSATKRVVKVVEGLLGD